MKILALDASTEALSVAVLDGAQEYERFEIAPRAHAQRLLPAVQALLAEAAITLDELDGFAFGRGPGAFTGLRIAAGLVQGLAVDPARPDRRCVAPVSTLAALAARCMHDTDLGRVRVVQDARMGEIYTADFVRGPQGTPQATGAERVMRPAMLDRAEETDDVIRAGNGWTGVAEARGIDPARLAPYECWPHALDIARLGQRMLAQDEGVAARDALPVYVRDDVARKPAFRG